MIIYGKDRIEILTDGPETCIKIRVDNNEEGRLLLYGDIYSYMPNDDFIDMIETCRKFIESPMFDE